MHVGIKWHHLGPDLCLSLINTFLVFNSAYSVKLSSYKKHIRLFLVITNNVQYLKDDKLLSTGVQKPISTRSCLSNISSNNKQNLPTTRFLKSLKTLFYHKKNTFSIKNCGFLMQGNHNLSSNIATIMENWIGNRFY